MLGHVSSQCHAVESYFVKHLIQIYITVLELTRMKNRELFSTRKSEGIIQKSTDSFFHGRNSDDMCACVQHALLSLNLALLQSSFNQRKRTRAQGASRGCVVGDGDLWHCDGYMMVRC